MSGERKRPIYIDCDPGLDDAVAIALAACSPELEIAALTVTAGNASLARTMDNALSVSAALGLKAPVHAGADRPLRVKLHPGTEIWGGDGSLGLKGPRRSAFTETAMNALVGIMKSAADHSLLLCCLGPLTNLAAALNREPALSVKIDRLLLMGGALGKGNVTAAAEFNIWFDPHAAKRVFDADLHTVIVPYDLTRTVIMGPSSIRKLSKTDTPEAQLTSRMLAMAGSDGHPTAIHDALVIACLLWPDLFSFERGRMTVCIEDGPARGQTRFAAGRGRHILLTSVDQDRLIDLMVTRLSGRTKRHK
jgi:inosine-uridine nucleoside N-ribohydrolase